MKKLYSAAIVLDTIVKNKVLHSEIGIFIVEAEEDADLKQAWIEAEKIGQTENHVYKNCYNEDVFIRFRNVMSVSEIFDQPIKHGSEIFSLFVNEEQLQSISQPWPDDPDDPTLPS